MGEKRLAIRLKAMQRHTNILKRGIEKCMMCNVIVGVKDSVFSNCFLRRKFATVECINEISSNL